MYGELKDMWKGPVLAILKENSRQYLQHLSPGRMRPATFYYAPGGCVCKLDIHHQNYETIYLGMPLTASFRRAAREPSYVNGRVPLP
jgi:hypothetical protein